MKNFSKNKIILSILTATAVFGFYIIPARAEAASLLGAVGSGISWVAQQNYFDFDIKYNTEEMQVQIGEGSARQAASAELAELQGDPTAGVAGKLGDARNRLQLCIQAQTPNY